MVKGILVSVVARKRRVGQGRVKPDACGTPNRHMVQAVAAAMDLATVKGLVVLLVVGLCMKLQAIERTGIKHGDVGELHRDKYNHAHQ